MKHQRQQLALSKKELKQLVGFQVADMSTDYLGTLIVGIIAGTVLILPVGLLTAFLWGVLQGSAVELATTIRIAALISYSVLALWILKEWRRSHSIRKRLSPLLKEVEKYNRLVAHIETIDQLAEIGNPVQVEDRETVIQGLQAMREQLVRALKTERILRDKPEFQSSEFSLDLTPLYALEVQQQATEYHKVLQDTLQIGESVQAELQRIAESKE
jgi:hypothetical protein